MTTYSGTFIYEDTSATNSFSNYIVNSDSSFTSISESITGSGPYTHSIDYTFTDNGTTSDGLFLKEKNINILQFGNIPLVRDFDLHGHITGLQFEEFTGKISATDTPTILNGTNFSTCFLDCTIPSSDFGNIGSWNVSGVSNFDGMFMSATNFEEDIRGWTIESTDNLNLMFRFATAMIAKYSGVSGFGTTPDYTFFNQTSPVCVLAGSIISTDQGDVKIENIKKGYTINGIKVTGLSKQVFLRDKLILIKKNRFDINVPNQDIYITPSHSIVHNGKLRECKKLALYNPELGLKYVKLDKTPVVYNVLCETHTTMKCNNLEMETMSLNHADESTHITYFY